MKKLNRKGYLTIEIILASVITFVIAFFLIDSTMKLVDIVNNAYADIVLITDKSLVVKNVREYISQDMSINGNIEKVECDENGKKCTIIMNNGVKTFLTMNGNKLEYSGGKTYLKDIHDSLSDISISSYEDSGYYNFKITGENIFIDEDYEMNINVYNKSVPILAASNTWYRGTTPKNTITKIKFVDDYIPTGSENESWEAAANLAVPGFNDEIMCYVVNGTELIIAGNGTGKIYANPNSNYIFGGRPGDESNHFSSLVAIEELVKLDTSMATTMFAGFAFCDSLTTLDIDKWDTSNVTNMGNLFIYNTSLVDLDINEWDMSSVTDMRYMFYACTSLDNLELSDWEVSNVENMSGMFASSLTYGPMALTTIGDVSEWDTSNVTNMSAMFSFCEKLETLAVSGWKVSNVTDMSLLFDRCKSLKSLDVSNWEVSSVENMSAMFQHCISIDSLDLSGWDVSNVTDMGYMFLTTKEYGPMALTTIGNVGNWDTSNVTSMISMFQYCSNLETLDVRNWDTSNVTNMDAMFYCCNSLTELDVSKWDTSNVTNMRAMFISCESLETLNISGFDTSKVTNMAWMFANTRFKSLDLSGFDTSKVTNMGAMFSDCNNLTILDLSSFDTTNVEYLMDYNTSGNKIGMFNGCEKLTTIYVSDSWNLSKVIDSTDMFLGSFSLVGGSGTRYSVNNIDATYARIDDPAGGNPGYLTYKENTI